MSNRWTNDGIAKRKGRRPKQMVIITRDDIERAMKNYIGTITKLEPQGYGVDFQKRRGFGYGAADSWLME